MKASIVSIGNSKGIRIPKTYLDELQIGKEVDMHIEDKSIVIQAVKNIPRSDWAQNFKKMAESGDDKLLISDSIDLNIMDHEWK
jgi:antitoxin MazE